MSATKLYGDIVDILNRTYPAIIAGCKRRWPNSQGEVTLLDVIHETIIKVLSDENVSDIKNDDEFIKYFLWRANTVIFRIVHDKKKQKKAYANYKTAEKYSQADEEG